MTESVQRVLSTIDYVIFAGMLLISALIGIFYAYRDRHSKHGTSGYLMGNRSMESIPVAISLAVSFQSAITILGIPADIYQFGMIFLWTIVSLVLVCLVISTVFIPTLYSLGISSTYEYLERRYSKAVRLITTVLYLVQTLLFMGINVYGPALALSGVTGFPLVSAMLSTATVCIFYTTLGGLRGVIWTDVFQGIVMVIGQLAFFIQGSIAVGGVDKVWTIARAGGRTDILRLETDPRIRYTVWSVLVGGFILWLGTFGTNQAQVQRLLSVKSQKKSILAMCLGATGIAMFSTLAVICGIVMYAFYHDCDPLTTQCVTVRDQLLPYAVMDLFRDIPGLPGLFLSSVFSASLSTVSSGINSMITVTIEDFVKPHTQWTEKQYTWVSKGLGVVFGAVILGVSFLASVLGDIVTIGIAFVSTFIGPSLGIFLLGLWFPFVNSIGAGTGFVLGNVLGMIMFFGGRSIKKPDELLGYLGTSTQHCPADCGYMDSINMSYFEVTSSPVVLGTGYEAASFQPDSINLSLMENFYALSFFYTASVGLAGTLVFGLIASLLSCGWQHRHEVDHRLIRPPFESNFFSWLPERIRSPLRFGISWVDHQKIAETEKKDEFECTALHGEFVD